MSHSQQPPPESNHSRSNPASRRPPMLQSALNVADGSSLFIEDRKGDRQNLSYGSPSRHSIPRYKAAGHGRLLGLDPVYRITSRSNSGLEVVNVGIDSTRKSRKQT